MKNTLKTTKKKIGRPSIKASHLIEKRILREATSLFMELGFARTSLDLVVKKARIGKSAIYGRYKDKGELFYDVVKHSIGEMFGDINECSSNLRIENRLKHVGFELLKNLLIPRCVSLMRITAAEAISFPELATMAYTVSYEGSVNIVVRAIEPNGKKVTDVTIRTAQKFVELAVLPFSMQALYGVDLNDLLKRSSDHIDLVVKFILKNKNL